MGRPVARAPRGHPRTSRARPHRALNRRIRDLEAMLERQDESELGFRAELAAEKESRQDAARGAERVQE